MTAIKLSTRSSVEFLVYILTLVLLASACGSTVQQSAAAPSGNFAGNPDNVGPISPDNVGGHSDGLQELSRGQGTSASRTDLPSDPRIPAPSKLSNSTLRPGAARTAVDVKTGRGFNETEIFIGVDYTKNADEAASSFGVSGNGGDRQAQNEAIKNSINEGGGIAGRKVVLVTVGYDVHNLLARPHDEAQRACTRWTEDLPVFAVVTVTGWVGDQTLSSCLAQRRTPQIAQNIWLRPQSEYDKLAPYLYAPSFPTWERYARAWINRLVAQNYFANGWDIDAANPGNEPTRVGIVFSRQPYGQSFRQVMRRELGKHNIPVSAEAEINDVGDEGSAVLRLRQTGVTHVLIENSGAALLFMTSAESQNYRPRYGIQSAMGPQFLQENVPARQLIGAIGIGHAPTLDVARNQDPGPISNSETQCRRVMERAGLDTNPRLGWRLMASKCDGWKFLKRYAVELMDPSSGIPPGESIDSAMTFNIRFDNGGYQFTGASAIRDIAFNNDCGGGGGCFAYASNRNRAM